MAWEWLTGGVVPAVSVLATTGIGVWTSRQQRLTSKEQLQLQSRDKAVELELGIRKSQIERTWTKRQEMLHAVSEAFHVMARDTPEEIGHLARSVPLRWVRQGYEQLRGGTLLQADIYASEDLRTAVQVAYQSMDKAMVATIFELDDLTKHRASLSTSSLTPDQFDAKTWDLEQRITDALKSTGVNIEHIARQSREVMECVRRDIERT